MSSPSEGRGILMVEHDMDLVMSVCDEIHVLDFGEVIASGAPAEVRNDPGCSRPTSATPTTPDADTRTDLAADRRDRHHPGGARGEA